MPPGGATYCACFVDCVGGRSVTKLRLPLQDKRLSLERCGNKDTLADKTYVAPGDQQSLNVVSGTADVDNRPRTTVSGQQKRFDII